MRLRLLLGVAVMLPSRAGGQVSFEACRDRTDHPIAVVVDNSIAYAGVATFRNDRPVILWNARTNQRLPPTEQLFIYLHECAHHVLDHLYHGEVGHPDVAMAWGNLAELLAEKGELAEAERAYQASLAILRAAVPAEHIYISGTFMALGAIRIDQGRAAEAEPLVREALAQRLQKLGPTDRRTAGAQRLLGLCLVALGRPAEAERFLLQSYSTLAAATNWYHRTLREHNVQDLVALYEGWGKPAEAQRYRVLLTGIAEPTRSTSLSP